MIFCAGCVSDVGIRRRNNQDSICYELAEYKGKQMAFLNICDGMGGLSKGEVASASVLTAFDRWFVNRAPVLVSNGFTPAQLREEWITLADTKNVRIAEYASSQNVKMGTTMTTAFFWDGQCYIFHIGDSRLYEISARGVQQLTKDHTVTQRDVDMGIIAPEDAETDPNQHILLQCIGTGHPIAPDFIVRPICSEGSYLICTDGFRHKFSTYEMLTQFSSQGNRNKQAIIAHLKAAIELIKNRGETDNITAGLLTVRQEEQ